MVSSGPTQHFTIIFNTFVMMTLFNEINARKIHGQRNVFTGLLSNPIFLIIWVTTFAVQVMVRSMWGKEACGAITVVEAGVCLFIHVSSHKESFTPCGESTVISIVSCRCTYCCQNQYTGKKFDNIHIILSWHCAMCKSVNCQTMSWA